MEFGAKVYVFWGGREGVETDATKSAARGHQALPRRHELPDCDYVHGQEVRPRSSPSRPSPTSRAATSTCPTTGHMPRLHRHPRPPRDGRRQPRGGARAHVGPQLHARAWPRPGTRASSSTST
ncbi:MAG: hypothetical protein MZV63_16010 [Marinilabiliales bacterium]|nr:hypothetical protein [Marinilabiliales bacterium]